MKKRYRLIRRGTRGGNYYCVDSQTGSRTSLGKISADKAEQIVQHKNTDVRQPMLNLQIARAYLAGSDSGVTTRTWGNALQSHLEMKAGANLKHWTTFSKDKAIKPLLPRILIETQAEELLNCVKNGTVSTNIFLRRLHNFCLDMGWIAWPIMPKRQWPVIRFKEKRGITLEEHTRIVEREHNPERKAFYKMAWHLGASQSDLASLKAEDRATEFKQRCDGLGIKGISMHSYRYGWAERAQVAGYPERFAQKALGHNSKAVHRAYARRAQVTLPPWRNTRRRSSLSNHTKTNPQPDKDELLPRFITLRPCDAFAGVLVPPVFGERYEAHSFRLFCLLRLFRLCENSYFYE